MTASTADKQTRVSRVACSFAAGIGRMRGGMHVPVEAHIQRVIGVTSPGGHDGGPSLCCRRPEQVTSVRCLNEKCCQVKQEQESVFPTVFPTPEPLALPITGAGPASMPPAWRLARQGPPCWWLESSRWCSLGTSACPCITRVPCVVALQGVASRRQGSHTKRNL